MPDRSALVRDDRPVVVERVPRPTGPSRDTRARLAFTRSRDPSKPTVVFVRGVGGSALQFRRLTESMSDRANTAMFLYENGQRLRTSGDLLRREVKRLSGAVVIVAHSMGGLLAAYVGATTRGDETRCVGAVYLNPLIGGSRYADAHDIAVLRWLAPVQPLLQRVFFPHYVRDLVPASDFLRVIFGPSARPSSFADRAVLLFTEEPGREPDIAPARVLSTFGTPRSALIAQLGQITRFASPLGHTAPLAHPEIVVPLIDQVLEPLRNVPHCSVS